MRNPVFSAPYVGLGFAILLSASMAGLGGCVGVVVGGAATGAAVANDPRTAGTLVEDESIELKAANALDTDPDIKVQTHINVTSYNEMVLVTGEAPTEALRQRTIKLVAGIAKVRHVYDEIRIAAPSDLAARTKDTYITTKVKTKFLATKDLKAGRVKVVTEAGTVYLMGLVTRAAGDEAAGIASKIGGVQRVVKLFEYQNPNPS